MADKKEIKEARRIARDVSRQVVDSNSRHITGRDSQGRPDGGRESEKFIREQGNFLQQKLRKKYPGEVYREYSGGAYSLTSGVTGKDYDGVNPYKDVEPSDPEKYSR